MNDFEKSFVLQMDRLRHAGYDFEAGARQALEGKFGGASVVLLRDLSENAKRDPSVFVRELSRVFGRGSMGFLEPIAKYGQMGLFPPLRPGKHAIDGVLEDIGPGEGTGSEQELSGLHDQRIRDEDGNYADEAN